MRLGKASERKVVDEFHKLYYNARKQQRTLGNTFFFGVPTQKCPLDLWVYQEILFDLKPNLVIETGTADGGSAYYMASLMDLMGKGHVITVDIEAKPTRPQHSRITYVHGSSTARDVLERVKDQVSAGSSVLVILDSDHSRDHVLEELRVYGPLVSKGSYLIVEDTNVNGHPVRKDHGPGPMEAVEEFLRETADFEVDREKEKFFLTFNPGGFLLRR
jgi:cephalosporin hydroxylase